MIEQMDQVRRRHAWKCAVCVEGPSPPAPTPSQAFKQNMGENLVGLRLSVGQVRVEWFAPCVCVC